MTHCIDHDGQFMTAIHQVKTAWSHEVLLHCRFEDIYKMFELLKTATYCASFWTSLGQISTFNAHKFLKLYLLSFVPLVENNKRHLAVHYFFLMKKGTLAISRSALRGLQQW